MMDACGAGSDVATPYTSVEWLDGRGGVRLYSRIDGPNTGGVVWFVLGPEAAGRPPYPLLTAALYTAGLATAVMHSRGTGFSEGQRGDVADYELVLSDYRLFLDHLRSRFATILLLGQSAGAALALEVAASAPTDMAGVVLVNPAWRLIQGNGMGPSLGQMVAYAVNLVCRPSATTVDMNAAPEAIVFGPDREEAEAMQRDRMVVRRFSVRYLLAQRRVMRRCLRNIAAVRAPVLLVQGAHDALVDPSSYALLLNAASVADKTSIVAPDGGHGSSAVETLVRPIVAWLTSHSEPASSRGA